MQASNTLTENHRPLIPGKPVYYTGNTLLFIVLSMVVLLYAITVAQCIYPGTSAAAVAKVAGLLPETDTVHPLWLSISRLIALIPAGSLAVRLNIFSTFCGVISVLLFYQISRMLIFELLFDKINFELVPDVDNSNASAVTPFETYRGSSKADQQLQIVSVLGALAGTLTLSFSAPFWLASTSFSLMSFATMLFLFTSLTALYFILYGSTSACLISFFLSGIGMVESGLYLIPLAITFFFIIKTSIQFEFMSESFLILLIVSFMLGMTLAFSILYTMHILESGIKTGQLSYLMRTLFLSHITEVKSLFPSQRWPLIIFPIILPLIISGKGVQLYFSCHHEIARFKWFILYIAVTALNCYLLLNLPGSPWDIAREGSFLPVFPYLCTALTISYTVAYWTLLSGEKMKHLPSEMPRPSMFLRFSSVASLLVLGVCIFLAIPLNYRDCDGGRAAFFDNITKLLLKSAQRSDYLVSDGFFDINLIALNKCENTRLNIIRKPPLLAAHIDAMKERDNKAAFTLINKSRDVSDSLYFDRHFFDWLRNKHHSGVNVAFIKQPSRHPQDLAILPSGLSYRSFGNGALQQQDDNATAETEDCLRAAMEILDNASPTRPLLLHAHSHIRSHLSQLANDRGVWLESQGLHDAAYASYTKSLEIDSDNICALLNLYGYQLKYGTVNDIRNQTQIVINWSTLFSRTEITRDLGSPDIRSHLFRQPTDIILPEAISMARGSEEILRTVEFFKKWHNLYAAPIRMSLASQSICNPSAQGEKDIFLSEIVKTLLSGNTERALNLLKPYLFKNPKNLSAWTLLAQIYLNNNDFTTIENSILPKMREVDETGTPLIFMVEGSYFKRKPVPQLNEARRCFLKAIEADDAVLPACNELLDTVSMLGDTSLMIKDAGRILSVFPEHPHANSIIGLHFLALGNLDQAKTHLERSLATGISSEVLCALATIDLQQKNFKKAEHFARRAIRIDPWSARPWNTLARTSLLQDNLNAAEKHAHCAVIMEPSDLESRVILTEIFFRKGEVQRAEELLRTIAPTRGTNDVAALNHI